MSYPAGVSKALLTVGSVSSFFGDPGSLMAVVTPLLGGATHITHRESGDVLIPTPMTFRGTEDELLNIAVPHVDQPGWIDPSGAAFTGWSYDVKVTATIPRGGTVSWAKVVAPVVGQALIDLDLTTDGRPGKPTIGAVPTVVSVLGKTGAVTAQDLIDAGVGVTPPGGGSTGPHTHSLADIVVKELDGTTNLNTVLTPDLYHQSQSGEATLELNYPSAFAGLLEVLALGGFTYQRFWSYGTPNRQYYRTYYSGTSSWSAWRTYADDTHTHAWTAITSRPSTFPSTWGTVSGKPTTFPSTWATVADKPTVFPSTWAQVADKPTSFPVAWTDVTGKPSTFPAAPPTWDEITGKPANLTGGTAAAGTGSLAALLALPRYQDVTTADTPTAFTVGTTDTMKTTGSVVPYQQATSPAGRQVGAAGRRDEGMAPIEFWYSGSELQLKFQAMNWSAQTTEVWVDNRPLAGSPITKNELVPDATVGYLYVKWSTARNRRIRIMNRGGAVLELRAGSAADQVIATTDTPLVGVVTDSFGGWTNYANDFQTFPEWMSRMLNANIMLSSVGGSGYLVGGQLNQKFGDGARQYLLRTGKLDALCFFGSINDPHTETEAVTRAAFRDTWSGYAAMNANAPLVVFGVQPAGAVTTEGSPVHRNNRLMYLEAAAHPRVRGFVDMLGTAKGDGSAPPAWSATTAYTEGSTVRYKGAIYRSTSEGGATFTSATVPSASAYWQRVSWVFTGTGKVGATTGDGNRDVLIGDDGTHPMPAAGYAFGALAAGALVRVLSSPGSFTYFNV